MKTIKLEVMMNIDDAFVENAKRWEHHADEILDLDSYPEIRDIHNCKVIRMDEPMPENDDMKCRTIEINETDSEETISEKIKAKSNEAYWGIMHIKILHKDNRCTYCSLLEFRKETLITYDMWYNGKCIYEKADVAEIANIVKVIFGK